MPVATPVGGGVAQHYADADQRPGIIRYHAADGVLLRECGTRTAQEREREDRFSQKVLSHG